MGLVLDSPGVSEGHEVLSIRSRRTWSEQKGVTFEAIAKAVGRHKVWVTSALLGQSTMSAEEAQKAVAALGLGPNVAAALQEIPTKGSVGQTVPVDPLIYRFHEITFAPCIDEICE